MMNLDGMNIKLNDGRTYYVLTHSPMGNPLLGAQYLRLRAEDGTEVDALRKHHLGATRISS
jgi:hypothetical protein